MISYISSLQHQALTSSSRKIAILGSTGSIGQNTIKVIKQHRDFFNIQALAGATNVQELALQAIEFRPPVLGVIDDDYALKLKKLLPGDYKPEIVSGASGYIQIAASPETNFILAAQVGAAGLAPSFAAAKAGKVICLANKEALVLAGRLFRQTCLESGAVILPVDSEHNAIFQALCGHKGEDVHSIILTASGGPFRGKDKNFLTQVTPAQALKHPNWSMGAKISIDSATLINKGLEVIEAFHLYGVELDKIRVLVHPQSIIHSLVEYKDGSVMAHLGVPNMQIPIAYCLNYPELQELDLPRLDLTQTQDLHFEQVDDANFPCLQLARQSLEMGQTAPTVLNAANEIAVDLFLKNKINFLEIPQLIQKALEKHTCQALKDIKQIIELDMSTRRQVKSWYK